MAIFHLTAKVISRGKGQSAIAAAAYRSGERLFDEQAEQQKFYRARSERIVFTDIMVPKNAPEWAHDRNTLWNQAERAEKRKDAQLAREIEIALPHELTDQQREWLVKDFAREAFVRKGYAVDIAIHAPDKTSDDRNHHAHLMVTTRRLEPSGFAKSKESDAEREAKRQQGWTAKQELAELRGQWANLANRHLERHGHAARIDHRSLSEQGVDREATVHLGYAANEMAQRGMPSDRLDALKEILSRNAIRVELTQIGKEIGAAEGEQAQAAARERQAAAERAAAASAAQQRSRDLAAQALKHQQTLAAMQRSPVASPTPQRDPSPVPPPSLPVRPIEDIQARHAAAENERQQKAAMTPTPLQRAAAQEVARQRFERNEPPQAAQPKPQQTWQINATVQNFDRVQPNQVAARAAEGGRQIARSSFRVADRATGVVSSLGDFLSNLLSSSTPSPTQAKPDMRALATDPEARKQHQLARRAEAQRRGLDEAVIDDIRRDIEAGRDLRASDVASLTRMHQEQILAHGDAYVRQMIEASRKRNNDYGRERERD